ncbi:MAG: leucine-rich repeat protein [Candidatus Izemoplasmatales bacterium]
MKKIIWLVFFFFFLFACNTNDNSTKTNITDSKTTTIENLDLELTYEITNNEIIITGFSGLSTLLYIPNQIEDYPVIAIQDSAFLDAAQFVNVILPENLKSIGENSFKNAISLEAIIIPDNVQTIGRWAFEHCVSLKSVEIGEGVTEIKLSTFRDCVLLETIILPKSLLIIDDEAFSGCTSLISIELPDSLSTIGRRAFSNSISLTNIYIPDSVITMDEDVFYNCSKLMLYLTLNEIPNTWNRDWNSYSCLIVNIEDMITISFETNGGSYVNNIYTFFGASIYIPQILCKTDNIFMGWYLDSALSTPYTSTTLQTKISSYMLDGFNLMIMMIY